MSNDPAICKRLSRAILAAKSMLVHYGTEEDHVIMLRDPDCPFHIEHIRKKEIRKIRVTIDKIDPFDEKICRKFILPSELFTKEIWCRTKGNSHFIKKEIR